MSQQNFRYPGVQPFQRSQSDRFFGRDDDSARFLSLILQEKLCVLYGKSGYGKSSLLNAGIQPRLDAETAKGKRRYVAVPIRFLAAGGQGDDNLFGQFDFHLTRAMEAAGIPKAADAAALPDTLWGCFKTWQTDPGTVFVLLFDQFEELFSYKAEQQLAFRQQLAELLYSDYPQFLEENEATLPPETVARLAEKTNVHTVLAIRADRVSELDRLRDHLPKIREKWFELRALNREQAKDALVKPASKEGDFISSKFKWSKEALNLILHEFSRDKQGREVGVEAFLLQVLAQNVERQVARGEITDHEEEGLIIVRPEDLPTDLSNIFSKYYRNKIKELPHHQQLSARKLIEDGLIFTSREGEIRRLSMDVGVLMRQSGADAALFKALEDTFLLRREVNTTGGWNYELSHDTLLKPVLDWREERLREETIAIAKSQKKHLTVAWFAGFLILIFFIFSFIYNRQLVNTLQESERRQVELYGEALSTISSTMEDSSLADMTLAVKVIQSSNSINSVLVDISDSGETIEDFRFIDSHLAQNEVGFDTNEVRRYLASNKNRFDTIMLNFDPLFKKKVYYFSPGIEKVERYPWIQLGLTGLLLLLGGVILRFRQAIKL